MKYLESLQRIFEENSNPDYAAHMSAYMKNRFPFYGIKSKDRRSLQKDFLKKNGLPEIKELGKIVIAAYKFPQREMQYFAIELVNKMKPELEANFIEIAEKMIVTKSWWDTVDAVASNIVGYLVHKNPDLKNTMDNWIQSENMWKQRTAIIYQLKFKSDTDSERLFEYCKMCGDSKEFFIRKGIGWALREYSKTDEKMIREYVEKTNLTPFSKREALKWLNRKSQK